jgi:beta-lactamase superfamily II metal-dependent hydrolase
MGYEIDLLGVGEESKSGDAIALRYGNLYGSRSEQTVVVIDGGYADNGQKLVDHIRTHYGTEKVDLVISTHPDQDHINGLETVIDQMEVTELWIHQPWDHNWGLADKFEDGRITDNSIGERLKNNLETAYKLVQQAEAEGVIVSEPFTGVFYDCVEVIGPSQDYYEELIPEFDGMPEAKKSEAQAFSEGFKSFLESAKTAIKQIFVFWGEDKIDDEDGTSAKNNSSVITQLIVEGRRLIFTGDAGITALDQAAGEIELCTSGAKLSFIQIPHHGSRRNVGPSVLNRIIGEPVDEGGSRNISAVASTAKEGEPKHPHKAVLNAFTHRGATVSATRGEGTQYAYNAPNRGGWVPLTPEPYHYAYDDENS